jgi:hypothetical protein
MIADRIRMYPRATRNASSAALIIIGVLAMYNWVLAPHLGYLHAIQKFESVVDRVVEERDRVCSTLDTKVGQWHTLQRELAELDDGVFTADQAKAFVRGLLPLVEETGCVVVLADFAGNKKTARIEDPNQTLVIEVSHLNLDTVGRPEQISALLQWLRDHRPRICVDSCQVDFSDGDSGRIECNLALTLYTVGNREVPAVSDSRGV